MWLRDGLPEDLAGARVLSYGYDSKLIQSETFQSVDNIADSFLVSMRSIRVHDRVSRLSTKFVQPAHFHRVDLLLGL
jgi:hypothetical protein